MYESNLLAQANAAFAAGRSADGLAFLRKYNLSNEKDAASWHRQAIIEEQIGTLSNAGKAHYQCIEIAPNNALGYLYAGYLLQQQTQLKAAAALYSLAQEIDSAVLNLENVSSVSEPTRLRSQAADLLMRQVLSQHHRDVCANVKNANRIGNAHWMLTNDQPKQGNEDSYSPELFFISELEKSTFYEPTSFEWASSLTDKTAVIQKELTDAMALQLTQNSLRPYLGSEFSSHANLNELANSSNWLAIDLFKNGELNNDVSGLFPETLKAIKTLPTYSLENNPYEVFFSFLKPKQKIAPHYGQSNHALTAHLALDIPSDCYLKVGSDKRDWQEGQVLLFDDSFRHSAHNQSDQVRIVLIFSVWHPGLSRDERSAIQLSFKARQKWLVNRKSHIRALQTI